MAATVIATTARAGEGQLTAPPVVLLARAVQMHANDLKAGDFTAVESAEQAILFPSQNLGASNGLTTIPAVAAPLGPEEIGLFAAEVDATAQPSCAAAAAPDGRPPGWRLRSELGQFVREHDAKLSAGSSARLYPSLASHLLSRMLQIVSDERQADGKETLLPAVAGGSHRHLTDYQDVIDFQNALALLLNAAPDAQSAFDAASVAAEVAVGVPPESPLHAALWGTKQDGILYTFLSQSLAGRSIAIIPGQATGKLSPNEIGEWVKHFAVMDWVAVRLDQIELHLATIDATLAAIQNRMDVLARRLAEQRQDCVYGRCTRSGDGFKLSYFVFFGYNDQGERFMGCPFGNHDGDWAGVTLWVDGSGEKLFQVVYHDHGRQIFATGDAAMAIANNFGEKSVMVFLEAGNHESFGFPGTSGFGVVPPGFAVNKVFEGKKVDFSSVGGRTYYIGADTGDLPVVRSHTGTGATLHTRRVINIGEARHPYPTAEARFLIGFPGLYGREGYDGTDVATKWFTIDRVDSPAGPRFQAKFWDDIFDRPPGNWR